LASEHHSSDYTVRVTSLVNGPRISKTPEQNDMKLDVNNYDRDITPHAKFGVPALTGAGAAYA